MVDRKYGGKENYFSHTKQSICNGFGGTKVMNWFNQMLKGQLFSTFLIKTQPVF